MPRRAIEKAAVDVQPVPEASEVDAADGAEVLQVASVEHRNFSAAPFAGIEPAIPVAAALGFVRLAHAHVPGLFRVGHVNDFDSVNALGEERRAADDLDARCELDGIVAREQAQIARVAGVDNPHAGFARDHIDELSLYDNLPRVVHSANAPQYLWCKRLGNVKRIKFAPRNAVERISAKACAHASIVDAIDMTRLTENSA